MKDNENLCLIFEYMIDNVPTIFIKSQTRTKKKVVFLFHKLLNNKISEIPLAYILAKNGYLVIIIDMHGHGDRAENNNLKKNLTGKYEFNNLFKDIYYTALDVGTVIEHLRENMADDIDCKDIGVVGVSAGGSVALVAGYLFNEISYVATLIGTCDWDYIINNKTLDSFRFHAQSNPVINYDEARDFANKYNPINNYNRASIKRIIFLNGMLDTTIPINIAHSYFMKLSKTFSYYKKEEYLEFKTYSNAGHEVNQAMIDDLVNWLGIITK